MLMRLRFTDLLAKAGMTPYTFAKASGGRMSPSTAYRIRKADGRLGTFDNTTLDTICDVLGVPPTELFER